MLFLMTKLLNQKGSCMDGKESKDDRDRCKVFDAIFKHGALTIEELTDIVSIGAARITRLVEHEWFEMQGGAVFIATVTGIYRGGIRGRKLAS